MGTEPAFPHASAALGEPTGSSCCCGLVDSDLSALTSLTLVLASVLLGDQPESFARALQMEYGRQSLMSAVKPQERPLLIQSLLAQLVESAGDLLVSIDLPVVPGQRLRPMDTDPHISALRLQTL